MSADLIKKIILGIVWITLIVLFFYIFFYVALFLILVGLIYYIYCKLFKQNKTQNQTYTKQNKSINNVIMDAEYKEKK